MTTWRTQDDDIQDDMYCAIELPELEEWTAYMLYCDKARDRREIPMDFEVWIETKNKRAS